MPWDGSNWPKPRPEPIPSRRDPTLTFDDFLAVVPVLCGLSLFYGIIVGGAVVTSMQSKTGVQLLKAFKAGTREVMISGDKYKIAITESDPPCVLVRPVKSPAAYWETYHCSPASSAPKGP